MYTKYLYLNVLCISLAYSATPPYGFIAFDMGVSQSYGLALKYMFKLGQTLKSLEPPVWQAYSVASLGSKYVRSEIGFPK